MSDKDRDGTAREILNRVDADQHSMIAPSTTRGADIDESDPVEVWAKRVGRVIGYGLLIVLTINLFTGWFF
jgi:hypothetical protein